MNTKKEKTDFEELEGDYELIPNEDWKSLKKTRRVKAEASPNDMHMQCLYAEALIFNDEFENALTFLTKLHHTEPQNPNIKNAICQALYALGKNESDFKWLQKPMVLKMDNEVTDLCYAFLILEKNPIPFLSLLECYQMKYDFVTFDEEELYNYLKEDPRFKITDENDAFWSADIFINQ